jgi:hypothetical protein
VVEVVEVVEVEAVLQYQKLPEGVDHLVADHLAEDHLQVAYKEPCGVYDRSLLLWLVPT